MHFLYSLIVGGIAGWLASNIMKSENTLFTDILLGIFGGMFAGWIADKFGIGHGNGFISHIIYSVIGAVLLIAIGRIIKKIL